MNQREKEYFSALSAKRVKSADALEDFALSGIKDCVVEKYSDQAHFIYELLQNADDAQATTARFELHKDKLLFTHNSERRFRVSNPAAEEADQKNGTLGDIHAITAVGGSNKLVNAIGKFGVGFKAVFQYTATPHIYDPKIFIKIDRFIVPNLLVDDYHVRKDGETLFVFPFDHYKKTSQDAYEEISEKLRTLVNPILFLSHLKEISFEISGAQGFYRKSAKKKRCFGETNSAFLCLTQNNTGHLCENIEFVFGPPGTGKTTHLSQNVILPNTKKTIEYTLVLFSRIT